MICVLGRYEADGPKVYVHGEVLHPGGYPLSQGMSVAQLVRMAGGFNRSALLADADLASYDIKDEQTSIKPKRWPIRIGEAVKNTGSRC